MKQFEQVICPCCGKNKYIKFTTEGQLEWIDYDPKNMEFINVREGGGKVAGGRKGRGQGRGFGFPKIGSFTIEETVKQGGQRFIVAKAIAQRLEIVVKEFKRVGLIK